jgi:hypothetical protein
VVGLRIHPRSETKNRPQPDDGRVPVPYRRGMCRFRRERDAVSGGDAPLEGKSRLLHPNAIGALIVAASERSAGPPPPRPRPMRVSPESRRTRAVLGTEGFAPRRTGQEPAPAI